MPPRLPKPETRRATALKFFNQVATERARLEVERSRIDARIEALKKWEADAIKQLREADQAAADAEVRGMLQSPVEPRNTKGFVYILQSPDGLRKIGRTAKPLDRLKTFSIKLPFKVDYELLIETDDMFALERALHQEFAGKRVEGEWFRLDTADVEKCRHWSMPIEVIEAISEPDPPPITNDDELYPLAVKLVRRLNKASISLLQRRMKIGYTRAARLIDRMAGEGIIGPAQEGSKPREVIPLERVQA